MDIVIFTVLGLTAGALAAGVLKRTTFSEVLMDLILGVFGALAGGIVMSIFTQPTITDADIYGILLAIVGAVSWITVGRTLKLV
jgi:uncharacterized membrane protein YeaQ/YmgE (transglycosylase-associated protein family)